MNDDYENRIPPTPDFDEIEAEQKTEQENDNFLKKSDWKKMDNTDYYLDPTEKFEKPDYTLSFDGVEFAPLGGIHALSGQAGNGKTFTFTQMIVAILKGEYGKLKFNLSEIIPNPTVLYIDTEMEKGNTQLVNMRVYSMLDWSYGVPHNEFRILRLRDITEAKDRWSRTLKAIDELKPTVCFIDGLLDLIGDFNDNKECQEIIYKCMATASHYNISLWCLVHQNPNTTKMVGHVGSMLERKITDGLSTHKIKNTENGDVLFEVKSFKTRGEDINDGWMFRIRKDPLNLGIPYQINSEETKFFKEHEKEDKNSKVVTAIAKIFKDNGNTPLKTGDLQQRLSEETSLSVSQFEHGLFAKAVESMGEELTTETNGRTKFYSLSDPDNYRDNITRNEVSIT